MRRGPGIVALDRSTQSSAQYSSLSNELNEAKVEDLRRQIDVFGRQLREFAAAHKKDIRQDPEFRHAFQQMCTSMWVDPLAGRPATASASSKLGKVGELWNDLLGFGDWQHELGVQIVDVCVSTRKQNGGIISMKDLIEGIIRLRKGPPLSASDQGNEYTDAHITEDDVKRSIQALRPLGCGYEVFSLNGNIMVRTVPHELSADAMAILQYLASPAAPKDTQALPFVTVHDMTHARSSAFEGWAGSRAQQALDDMTLGDGTLWLDIVPADASPTPELLRQRYYSLAMAQNALQQKMHRPAGVLSTSLAQLRV